jgi:hypothetical protein
LSLLSQILILNNIKGGEEEVVTCFSLTGSLANSVELTALN